LTIATVNHTHKWCNFVFMDRHVRSIFIVLVVLGIGMSAAGW
jgi:hypothetical protein